MRTTMRMITLSLCAVLLAHSAVANNDPNPNNAVMKFGDPRELMYTANNPMAVMTEAVKPIAANANAANPTAESVNAALASTAGYTNAANLAANYANVPSPVAGYASVSGAGPTFPNYSSQGPQFPTSNRAPQISQEYFIPQSSPYSYYPQQQPQMPMVGPGMYNPYNQYSYFVNPDLSPPPVSRTPTIREIRDKLTAVLPDHLKEPVRQQIDKHSNNGEHSFVQTIGNIASTILDSSFGQKALGFLEGGIGKMAGSLLSMII